MQPAMKLRGTHLDRRREALFFFLFPLRVSSSSAGQWRLVCSVAYVLSVLRNASTVMGALLAIRLEHFNLTAVWSSLRASLPARTGLGSW